MLNFVIKYMEKVNIIVYNEEKQQIGDGVDLTDIKKCYINKNIGMIGEDEMQKYAVIIPLINVDGQLQVLFEVRAKHMRTQPGEVAFPGGAIEPGEDKHEAAVRETCEELGITVFDIEIIGTENYMVTQHGRIIYPFIGMLKDNNSINPSTYEVDHVFTVPLEFFIKHEPIVKPVDIVSVPSEDFPYELIENGVDYKWRVGKNHIYLYKYENHTIWGLTARMLFEFIKTIKEMEKNDDTYKRI